MTNIIGDLEKEKATIVSMSRAENLYQFYKFLLFHRKKPYKEKVFTYFVIDEDWEKENYGNLKN